MSDKSLKKVYKKLFEYSNKPSPYQPNKSGEEVSDVETAQKEEESTSASKKTDISDEDENIDDTPSYEGEKLDPATEAILQAEFAKKMRL